MFFDFPIDSLVKGYKLVIDFYVDFRVMHHLLLFIILAWWFTHPRIQNKRFLSGYLSFTFLGLTGAMSHTVELIGASAYSVSIYFKLFELLLFVLFFIMLIDAVRGKSILHLPAGPLRWVGLIPIMVIFWYMDKSKCPQGYIFKFFERISFLLCITTFVDMLEGKNIYHLPKRIWKWWVIIPLCIGIWYPWYSAGGLKAVLFSPYGLLPTPTLLVAVSLITLSERVNKVVFWVITLAGFYFGLIGWLKLKLLWDLILVVTSLYALIYWFCRGKKIAD